MRVAACVLTYNPVRYERLDLLRSTLDSLKGEADEVFLVDNGSDDGFDWPVSYRNTSGLTTSGMGTNVCARVLAGSEADICVLSDDDIVWRPGWRDTLEQWWTAAPDHVWLTGCHLEPEYPWNGKPQPVMFGGIRGLRRESTGAATWTYRQSDFHRIFPIPQQVQGWGDVPACDRIDELGGWVCQLDLADHCGQEASTWGNITATKYGDDIEPVRRLVR